MLDVHPPEHAAHTWRDFFIHIATIVVGLFIAVGLEQTVEHFHHLHQRHQLEDNLRDELRVDLRRDAMDFRRFADIRAYTVELKSAVTARRTGHPSPPAPPAANDPRRNELPSAPSIAIWEAAKLDATITLLPSKEINLYNAIILQHSLIFVALDDFQHAAFALESFEERFIDTPGAFDMGYPAPPPSLDAMSTADLTQYETLLATYIKAIDRAVVRLHFFDAVDRAILAGATDHDELSRRAFPTELLPHSTFRRQPTRAPTHDRHPPAAHAPITWPDFFIHLGTVILGILIAIGLEQTVEVLHRHQRHQLEEDLHAEMQMNNEYLSRDYDYLVATRDWGCEPGADDRERHWQPHNLTSRLSTAAAQLRFLRPAQRFRLATRQRGRYRRSPSSRRSSELHPSLPLPCTLVRHLQAALRRALRGNGHRSQILVRTQPPA